MEPPDKWRLIPNTDLRPAAGVAHIFDQRGLAGAFVSVPLEQANCYDRLWTSTYVGFFDSGEPNTDMSNLDLFRHDFVVSIKPEYATKIMSGEKTVELRRRFPYGTVTGARMYVYASAPIQAVVGFAVIKTVHRIPPEEIWERYSAVSFIKRDDFVAYYAGSEVGYVLVLDEVTGFAKPIPLITLKDRLGFSPPQSFAYADDKFRDLVHGLQT